MTDSAVFIDTPDPERRVRSHEAETSWVAATIQPGAAKSVRDSILHILATYGPLTDDEIYAQYRADGGMRTPQRVRTAREELINPKEGRRLIREHHHIGYSALGNAARQWVIA